MKCPECGRELPYGSKYCLFCDLNVENDEIPTPSEPTRVMPAVGKPKKKAKLKAEKKRQLVLFYGSVAAIVLLIVILFVVIFKSCSKPDVKTPAYSSISDTSSADTVSVDSTVSLPFYNSVNTESSETQSSAESSLPSSSQQTSSEAALLPASDYLSFTVADLKKSFGEVSSTESNEGEGSIISFKNCNYKFIVDSSSVSDSDRVSSIIVLKGGEIISGAVVGQTYNEIYNSFDSAFQFSFDESEDIAIATTSSGNKDYYIYFEKADKNTPSLSALIKLK